MLLVPPTVKLAFLQNDPRPGQFEANVASAFAEMRRAAAAGCDVAVLPEMWPRCFVDRLDEAPPETWTNLLARWQAHCRELKLASLGGLPWQAPDGRYFNALFCIGSDGAILGRYDKLHLFSYMNEQKRYAPGKDIRIVELAGLRFGLTICYDLRFPELYRSLRAQGADVLVVIAQWPTARGDHWRTLLSARAIENLCYVVGVNRCGSVPTADGDLDFPGASMAVDPWGKTLVAMGAQPDLAIVDLDATRIAQVRKEFRSWDDRRFEFQPAPTR